MTIGGWVAEEPEAHLLPDLERAPGFLPGDNPAFATHGHLLRIRFA